MNDNSDNTNRIISAVVGFGWAAFICWLISMMAGCSTVKYVPVETIKTERVEVHDTVCVADTVHVSDSTTTTSHTTTLLQKVDSAYLAGLGVINAPQEAWLLQHSTDTQTDHKGDVRHDHHEATKHSADSVRIEYRDRPIPVEKPLTRWQQLCIDVGGVTTGATLLLLVILIARLWRIVKKAKNK